MARLLFLLLAASVVIQDVSAQTLRSIPFRRVGVIADSVGAANLATADLDGDGKSEIVSCSQGAPFAVSHSGSTFVTSWMGPSIGCTGVTAGDRDGDGGNEVIVTTSGTPGKLVILDPRNLAPSKVVVTLPGTAAGVDVAIGNVDSDPGNEIVVLTLAHAYIYDGATLVLKWTAQGYGGKKVRLGDVDGDGRLDIVINSSSGWVLDGQTQTAKFGYLGGFGLSMAVGDVDNDGKAEIVFSMSWSTQLTILNGDTMQTSSIRGNNSQYSESVAIADANADGLVEIITGNNQWGAVEGRRPSDGLLLWDINNPEHGAPAVAAADVTGDGKADVIWGAGHSSSGDDSLFVGNAVTEAILWESLDLDGAFTSVTGDLDGDGRLEYVVASGASHSGYSGSVIEVFDVPTGASKGVISLAPNTSFQVKRLAIGQTDSDPANEVIALGGTYSYDAQLLVWDGITRVREFTSAVPPCCSSPGFVTSTLVVSNIDADAVDEIILGNSDSRVLVLNGASNFIQSSVPLNGAFTDLALADLNGDTVMDLLVGTSSTLTVYNTSTWSVLGQVALAVRKVAATAGGVSAAVSTDGTLRTYGGVTLAAGWNCSTGTLGTTGTNALAFATIGGSPRLLAGDSTGNVRSIPVAGATCPAFATTSFATTQIGRLATADVTGDGRTDLLIDSNFMSEIHLIGLSTEMLGDVDSNGFVDSTDIAWIFDYTAAGGAGLSPAGDANDDQRIGVEDVFRLINHRYAGGPVP